MTKIAGVGSYVPDNIYTNEQLEEMVEGVDAKWTKEALNIEKRHIYGVIRANFHEMKWPVEEMAYQAAVRALGNAGIKREDVDREIDMVIIGTTTQQERSPSAACVVSEMLGCPNAVAFDISAACAGFVYALNTANSFIQNGTARSAVVIGSDAYSRITDWTHRNCVFFGDGAGAVVLKNGNSIMSGSMGASSDMQGAWFVHEGKWQMDGKAVFKLAVEGIRKAVDDALLVAGVDIEDVSILIPHQPGIRVLMEAARLLGLPFEKVHTVMDKYANTAAASVPIALDDALKGGKIKEGDIVVLATVGAGWTWASTVLKWV
jgi:3-oxoacyl-[acyl-carrier-protein] synthase-3